MNIRTVAAMALRATLSTPDISRRHRPTCPGRTRPSWPRNGLPHVMLAEGLDPTTEYRPALRSAIGSAPDFPVWTGSHDLVLAYPWPPQDHARPASFGYGNPATPDRPFLGMGDLELDRVSNPAPLLGRMNRHRNPYQL